MHQLQGPFEESILDTLKYVANKCVVDLDAQSRRRDLLEGSEYVRLCGRKWKQRHGERYHPFWKLTAQMSFGVNLLVKALAKSDIEVLKILQCHVDEMDGFLGRTTEDFLIIQIDVRTRIQYLSLPLENLGIFDEMLEDRSFRRAMIEYNEKIEHAISRFSMAIKDALKDIQKGREAIGALWQYLRQSAKDNSPLSNNLTAVYNAMLANTEGWNVALSKLQRKGLSLQSALSQLGLAITEMQRRVGVASRKEVASFLNVPSAPVRARSIRERFYERRLSTRGSRVSVPEKPLPSDPRPPSSGYVRPPSGQVECRLVAQKSAPNLRAPKLSRARNETNTPNSANHVNGTTETPSTSSFLPKIHRNLGTRLSKASLTMKKSTTDTRPATAPPRTLKSRSMSIEQLTNFRKMKKEPSLDSSALPRPGPRTVDSPKRHDTMKTQLSQYFKTDRVVDAWETVTQRNKPVRRSSQTRKDGPWSKFRAKSSNIPGTSGDLHEKLFEEDLEKQMAWLQDETEGLNTYSLKPRREVAPRIHVLSVHMTLAQESDEREEKGKNDLHGDIRIPDGDTHSIITALPSVPYLMAGRTEQDM
ncbi:hypothetical protein FE257_009796 [Aspergillus nanangensis]|uniref:Uncharacterized protein n=1 Tax=Aspergillus nanangensis TaxID=2582783 RepID=A0AAD4CJA3_ASPNN|nr:hypothetical protein FE257_009796 [Aspergillus nanangensis]